MFRFLAIALLMSGLLGCRSVKPNNVAGTWTMTESSREILPAEVRQNSAKIVLEANGTFVASDLPGIFDFPPARPRLDGGSGVWKIVSREGKQQVQLDFQVIPSGRVATNLPFSTQMEVSDSRSGVRLYYFLGDPDEALRVEFERK
jgi:hypothetical protein